jgi:hypothetical protein
MSAGRPWQNGQRPHRQDTPRENLAIFDSREVTADKELGRWTDTPSARTYLNHYIIFDLGRSAYKSLHNEKRPRRGGAPRSPFLAFGQSGDLTSRAIGRSWRWPLVPASPVRPLFAADKPFLRASRPRLRSSRAINLRAVVGPLERSRFTPSRMFLLVPAMKHYVLPPPAAPTWVLIATIIMLLCALGFVPLGVDI